MLGTKQNIQEHEMQVHLEGTTDIIFLILTI